ncbi:hypothetical protein [Micromonospora sp. C95]|uniref:hypothetical protein n=1 Tax=Micromonospora sp. C95 TaxID=2824882 RepID=UPI001B374165|nr:hypothetical protein [Micromonospora sp. C95]MBQ1023687.1 hypothetical protein [Micromonospora sp. C95]
MLCSVRWFAASAIAYAVFHHVGSGFAWLGPVGSGSTRWADWIDLATPYAFLLPAAASLWRAGGTSAVVWLVYLAGAVTYVEGHGVHLSANSISNATSAEAAHLWDEVVGHYLWFTGAMLVWAALATIIIRRDPPRGPVPALLALAVGTTAATNALEGGTAVLGLAAFACFAVWGWLTRAGSGQLVLIASLPALLVVAGWGVWHAGFPQPSELGWG